MTLYVSGALKCALSRCPVRAGMFVEKFFAEGKNDFDDSSKFVGPFISWKQLPPHTMLEPCYQLKSKNREVKHTGLYPR